MANNYIWASYRDWSFKVLEGIQDLEGWRTGLVITTKDCVYDFSRLEKRGVPILRLNDPKRDLKEREAGYKAIEEVDPNVIFYHGWSWMVPDELLNKYSNLVLHPGKLPQDRGGSPIQNQMRRGETWTYANLIELGKELDAGPIHFREKISLEGEADDVWARMTAAGIITAKSYLDAFVNGTLNPIKQVGEPTIYKRVRPEQSELTSDISSVEAERIVRAHNETDPNSYVVPAFIKIPGGKLVVERATLTEPMGIEQFAWTDLPGSSLDKLVLAVNNGEKAISFSDKEGRRLYLTRVYKI